MRCLIIFLFVFASIVIAKQDLTISNQIPSTNYSIENQGQWPEEVKYLARIGGMDAWITDHGGVVASFQFTSEDQLAHNGKSSGKNN